MGWTRRHQLPGRGLRHKVRLKHPGEGLGPPGVQLQGQLVWLQGGVAQIGAQPGLRGDALVRHAQGGAILVVLGLILGLSDVDRGPSVAVVVLVGHRPRQGDGHLQGQAGILVNQEIGGVALQPPGIRTRACHNADYALRRHRHRELMGSGSI